MHAHSWFYLTTQQSWMPQAARMMEDQKHLPSTGRKYKAPSETLPSSQIQLCCAYVTLNRENIDTS